MKSFLKFILEQENSSQEKEKQSDQPEKNQNSAEIALDPTLDKEFFLDMFETGNAIVKLKTLGTGPTAPVVVYINDQRWELFPGPVRAKKAARAYVRNMNKNNLETPVEKDQAQ